MLSEILHFVALFLMVFNARTFFQQPPLLNYSVNVFLRVGRSMKVLSASLLGMLQDTSESRPLKGKCVVLKALWKISVSYSQWRGHFPADIIVQEISHEGIMYMRRAAVDTCKTPFPLVYFILSSYTPISSGDSLLLSNGATARSPSFSSHFSLTFSSSLGFFPMDFCPHLTTTNHKEVLSKAFLIFQSIKGSGTFLNSVNYHYSPYK